MFRSFRCRRLLGTMLACMACFGMSGCHLLFPDVSHQPVIHNPFPQLSRVAVAPFFNLSDEPTVDGRKFAIAYFTELQSVPGYEVVPLGVVEETILEHRIDLSRPEEARRLANILGVDVVVIGSVTDYSPYYPPRCGMRVEWYAANSGFHEIPAGYGLPWGTPEEEFIPGQLVFESEFALAKAQLATQTPICGTTTSELPLAPPKQINSPEPGRIPLPPQNGQEPPDHSMQNESDSEAGDVTNTLYEEEIVEELPPDASTVEGQLSPMQSALDDASDTTGVIAAPIALPASWPDERGFIPPPPSPMRPACCPHNGPVMTHTRIYHGTDSDFTEALASYYHFRDDARFGGWQNYLQRSDDFIRFCCHMHISEMLSARGGAGETRVVWNWSDGR